MPLLQVRPHGGFLIPLSHTRGEKAADVSRISDTACTDGWSDSALIGVLVLCATLPYVNTLLNGFVYDDNRQVLDNPYIRSFHFLPKIFGTTVWSFVGAQGVSNYYRPMMTLGYLFCYKIFGPLAYGFHLGNVCLHAAIVCMIFMVARRMFSDRGLAFLAACLFALHPVHTESVAWIAAVTDLELTFFYLLTFWLFLQIARPAGGRSAWVELAMTASFALTIFSKEQSLTLPLVAMIYEHLYREDRTTTSWTQKLGRYGVLWLMDVAYIVFRIERLGAFAPQVQLPKLGLYSGVLSALSLVGQYAAKMIWPAQLCAYYVFHRSGTLFDPRVLAGIGILIVCAAMFAIFWRRSRTASFALVWFFVTLAPVLDVRYLAGNVFAERYLYLPSVGFCWLAGWVGANLWRRTLGRRDAERIAMAAAGCAIALTCAVRIFVRNCDWRNDVTLYTQTLKISPTATHIRENLGVVNWDHGNIAGAEKQWNLALQMSPGDPIALTNLGLVYAKRKEFQKAADCFRQAMLRKPNYTDPHLNLGSLDLDQENYKDAELQLRAAVVLSPLISSGHNKLAKLYLEEGKLAAAKREFTHSVEAEANFEGYDGLGEVGIAEGNLPASEKAFRSALTLNPYDSYAHFGLARIAAATGRRIEALKEYAHGFETDPNNLEAKNAVQKLRTSTANAKMVVP